MKEAYCSYKISKLLREKGFNERIFEFYEGDKIKYARNGEGFRLSELPGIYYPHITHQMAMAWLRKKGIYITIVYGDYPTKKKVFWTPQIDSLEGFELPDNFYQEYDLYEDAVEAALEYALENLI